MKDERKANARFILILATCLLLLASLFAFAAGDAKRVAVLEFRNPAGLQNQEIDYLTDLIRTEARKMLPRDRYILMTKENIYDMLPPDKKDLSQCEGQCEVETGRSIGADYLVTGDVVDFGGELRVTVRLYDVATSNLLESRKAAGNKVLDLEVPLERVASVLFAVLPGSRRRGGAPFPGGVVSEGAIGEESAGEWMPSTDQTVVVRFESDPGGAVVMDGGNLLCKSTPCSKELTLGSHTISMQSERYQSNQDTVNVQKGMKPISWKLNPNFGWLSVESTPSGLTVTINGESAGNTPIKDKNLDSGVYEVLVTDPRYVDKGERVQLSAGERQKVSVTLQAREGAIKVSAQDQRGNALAGQVYVDGQKVGGAPGTHKALVGAHRVEVKTRQGDWSGTVQVKEQQVSNVVAEVNVSAPSDTPSSSTSGTVSSSQAGIQWVRIPGGTFKMGSNQVTLSTFEMSKTEVTVAQYGACVNAGACTKPKTGKYYNWGVSGRENHPINGVDWNQAVTFARWAGGRLPTEAQWEYAARAGTTTRFACGDSDSCLDSMGWYSKNSGKRTHSVRTKRANSWGLYDMHGNVWEWVSDWYGSYPSGSVTDPVGPSSGSYRVYRGGGWRRSAGICRSANRLRNSPGLRADYLGFRLARSLH